MKARESNCLTKEMLFVTRTRALVESNPFGPMTLSDQPPSEWIQINKFLAAHRRYDELHDYQRQQDSHQEEHCFLVSAIPNIKETPLTGLHVRTRPVLEKFGLVVLHSATRIR